MNRVDKHITGAEHALEGHDDVHQFDGLEGDHDRLVLLLVDLLIWSDAMGVEVEKALADARRTIVELKETD